MSQISLKKPLLIAFYGFPGAGKSRVAKNLEEIVSAALISDDRIRSELFSEPKYTEHETSIVRYVADYMSEEFLKAGISVIYDAALPRQRQRQKLVSIADRNNAQLLLIWLQIDPESAFLRTQTRDHRKAENRHAAIQTRESFNNELAVMQNPQDIDYLVVSGKHSFATQKSAILNRLYQMGLVDSQVIQSNIAKPGLVNLVPTLHIDGADISRRNINIE